VILVDTSVWIDFFAGRDLPHVDVLEQCILDNEDLALCGIILTEILQGIADDTTHRRVRRYLSPLIMLPMPETVFVRAADIYRKLRKKGITIPPMDVIIAQVCLHHKVSIFTLDEHFHSIPGLKFFNPGD